MNEWLCAAHGAAVHTTPRRAAVHGTTRMRWDAAAEWGEWDRVGWAVEPCEREGRVAQRLARGCEAARQQRAHLVASRPEASALWLYSALNLGVWRRMQLYKILGGRGGSLKGHGW